MRLGRWSRWVGLGASLAAGVVAACSPAVVAPVPPAPATPADEPIVTPIEAPRHPPAAARLPPLSSDGPFVDLAVPGHGSAVASLPLGATDRRPVLVVAHGAGDRPEWHCQVWRRLVGDRGFVLCPRGSAINRFLPEEQRGYYYVDHHALGREISSALEALEASFPGYVDLDAPSYAGFSQGAIMGAILLPVHPARFARAALIEGGYGHYQEWSLPVAEAFKRHGAERVLLACGGLRCVEEARVTARYFARAGLDARIVHAEGAGHTYDGAMEREVGKSLGWVTEGDPRW